MFVSEYTGNRTLNDIPTGKKPGTKTTHSIITIPFDFLTPEEMLEFKHKEITNNNFLGLRRFNTFIRMADGIFNNTGKLIDKTTNKKNL